MTLQTRIAIAIAIMAVTPSDLPDTRSEASCTLLSVLLGLVDTRQK